VFFLLYFESYNKMIMFYKFILHVHFRRLIYTTDPQYPTVLASGTMPSLTLHVNEQKVAWPINVSRLFKFLIRIQQLFMDSSDNICNCFKYQCENICQSIVMRVLGLSFYQDKHYLICVAYIYAEIKVLCTDSYNKWQLELLLIKYYLQFTRLLSGADNQCLSCLPVSQTSPPHPFINQSKPVTRQPDIPIRECKWTLPV